MRANLHQINCSFPLYGQQLKHAHVTTLGIVTGV